MKFNEIRPQEHKFTEVLESIALTPKTLYFYGKIPENVSKAVAIVGARRNTRYGEEIAYKFAYDLAKKGVLIVSGLAYGIDSVAHRAALDAGGKTLAILGTAIDNIYPHSHRPLAEKILEQDGCIMSEYPAGSNPNAKYSFLERNRLISALSDATIVVEAAIKSGSLNTAMHALEQNKDLFAVPGDINRPMSAGCNRLIKEGAMPLTCLDDILGVLFPSPKKRQKRLIIGDTPEETAILKAIELGLRDGEEIIKTLKISVADFNRLISLLEIKGQVRSLGANHWALV